MNIDIEKFKALGLLPLDIRGWHGTDPIFKDLIQQVNPATIFEVGSWKGQSTITMAQVLKEEERDCKIYAIDTWLGAVEFIGQSGDWDLMLKYGYPQVYYQFLSNIVHSEVEDYIIPFPNTSAIAARYFAKQKTIADLIYIDGSHDYDDVCDDIGNYWHLLNKGGIMFGDDYDSNWESVVNAVQDSFDEDMIEQRGGFWIVRK